MGGLKKENGGGGGDIEGLDTGLDGDADGMVANGEETRVDPAALVAEEEQGGAGPIEVAIRGGGATCGGERFEVAGGGGGEQVRGGESGEEGEPKGGTHGGTEGLGGKGVGRSGEGESSVGAGGLGGAKEGAQIAGILDTVESDEERRAGKAGPE